MPFTLPTLQVSPLLHELNGALGAVRGSLNEQNLPLTPAHSHQTIGTFPFTSAIHTAYLEVFFGGLGCCSCRVCVCVGVGGGGGLC